MRNTRLIKAMDGYYHDYQIDVGGALLLNFFFNQIEREINLYNKYVINDVLYFTLIN